MCNTGECNSGGLAIPNYSGKYISHSIIYLPELLKNDPDFYSSSGSDTEVHEILHVFGIGHSNVIGGVMFPSNSGMRKNIEDNIISCLKKIYSNGEFDGDCSKVNFSSNKVSCEEGWYEVEGTDYCCPEPNMKIVDGYYV